jgi:hypothetical protein
MKYFSQCFALMALCLFLIACVPYSGQLTPVTNKANTYRISILGSMGCDPDCAFKNVDKTIKQYMSTHNFSSYKIVKRTRKELPNNQYIYIIKLSR